MKAKEIYEVYRPKLEERLEELRPLVAEFKETEELLAAWDRAGAKSRRRVPVSERKTQILKIVHAEPGITAKSLGERLGLSGSRIVQIVNALEQDGTVVRLEGGVIPAPK
jgi:ribosomal protein S25